MCEDEAEAEGGKASEGWSELDSRPGCPDWAQCGEGAGRQRRW